MSTFPLGTDPCGTPPAKAVFHDAAYFADLWERIYPTLSYLAPLKSPGPGYEVLQAYAKLGERFSLAIARLEAGNFILSSFGGALANGTVQFSRPNAGGGVVTVLAGTIVKTSNGNRRFATTANAAFGISDVGPISVQVVAVAPGWEYNVPGQVVTARGEILPGDVDTIDLLLESPAYGDPTIVVTNISPICGGRPAMLDQLGQDRGLPRNSGEIDVSYQNRVRTLVETVSPDAIISVGNAIFAPFDYALDFIETWDPAYQTCWDAAGLPGIDTNLFCYDDPRPAYPPFRNRWLDEEDFRGAFIIVVPNIGAISDVGQAYDDTATGPTAVSPDTGGLRAISAYDVLVTTPVQQGGYDGFDLAKAGVYKGLYETISAIKAAGVFFAIELRGQ